MIARDIPATGGSFPIYRWSTASASTFKVLGPNGQWVAEGLLRRNGAISKSTQRENTVSVSVDTAVFPSTKRVMIVNSQDHMPDASAPSGSAVDYWTQHARSVAGGVRPCCPSGSLAFTAYTLGTGHVAELWGLTWNSNGDPVFALLDYQAIGARGPNDRDQLA